MITKIFSPDLSNKEQLRQLVVLRLFYLLSEVIAMAAAQWWSDVDLPWMAMWALVLTHILLTAGYYLFSRTRVEITVPYLMQTILIDLFLFTALLYLSGGATNGAVSILLLPVATAASLFRWRLSVPLALLAIGCYSVLMFYFRPVADTGHMHHQMEMGSSSAHLLGMWFAFIFSCLLLVWFIGQQSNVVREKNKNISALREEQLRDEQLIAIATFAANAAHDLATPLSSISLLCEEVKEDLPGDQEGIDMLITQVELCRSIVQSISHKAILNHSNISQDQAIGDYFQQLIERWLVTRPDINLDMALQEQLSHITFRADAGLESAMTNILDNAANASVANGFDNLNLQLEITEDQAIRLKITDFGSGIDDELISKLGKAPVTSKADGLGLGQFLANSTIERNGGNVWRKSSDSGTETLITLPLKRP